MPARKLTRYRAIEPGIRNADLERRFFAGTERPVVERHVLGRDERAVAIEQRDDGRQPFDFDAARRIADGAGDRQHADFARMSERDELERLRVIRPVRRSPR